MFLQSDLRRRPSARCTKKLTDGADKEETFIRRRGQEEQEEESLALGRGVVEEKGYTAEGLGWRSEQGY